MFIKIKIRNNNNNNIWFTRVIKIDIIIKMQIKN